MTGRTIEDGLRSEYFDLLPEVRRVAEHLETVIRYYLLPITGALSRYEQVTVKSRVKEYESAVNALRRRQQFASFDPNSEEAYTLTGLRDLAGVRVLAFPHSRVQEVDALLRQQFIE